MILDGEVMLYKQLRTILPTEIGNLVLDLDYWDCECEDNYIHHIDEKFCPECGNHQEDQPSSRAIKVKYNYNPILTSKQKLRRVPRFVRKLFKAY